MPSNPTKSVQEYIYQGVNIQDADTAALAVPEIWALVLFIRTRLDDRLADLQNKSIIVNTIAPAYDDKVEEKDNYDADAEEALEKLAVYIENAFPDEAETLNHTLLIDKDYPADDEKAKQHLIQVQATLAAHDNVTWPLPVAYTDAITNATTGFIAALAEVSDLLEDRRTAIQDRDIALLDFIDVLAPIRKWLWKTLPQGRKDTRLIDYGFDPYSTSSTPSDPEPPPEPLIPWPGPAPFEAEHLGGGAVEYRTELVVEGMTDGTTEKRKSPDGDWEMVVNSITIEDGKIIPFREFNVEPGEYECRFIPLNADGEPGLPTIVNLTVEPY